MLTFDYPPEHVGGVGTHSAGLADALVRAGHEVAVVAGPFEGPGAVRVIRPRLAADGTIISRQLERAPVAKRDREHAYLSLLKVASGVASKLTPSVVHTQDVATSRAALRISHQLTASMVCTVHTVEEGRRLGAASEYDRGIDAMRVNMISAARAAICVSEALRREVIARLAAAPEKLVCVYGPIDSQQVRATAEAVGDCEPAVRRGLAWARGRPIVVFLGRIAPEKDPELFVRVAREFVSSVEEPGCAFLMVGDGRSRILVERLIRELRLEEHARTLGRVPHSVALGLLRRSAALLVTSAYDVAPVIAIEAMALGTPIISTSAPGIVELLGGGRAGLVVPDGATPRKWVDLLRLVLSSHPSVAQRTRAAGELLETRHQAALVANRTLAVYRQAHSWAPRRGRSICSDGTDT